MYELDPVYKQLVWSIFLMVPTTPKNDAFRFPFFLALPRSNRLSLIYIFRLNQKIFAVLPHVFQPLIPAQRFSHIERILAVPGESRRIVAVVIYHPSED